MFKNFLFNRYHKKISKLNPSVDINVTKKIPLPSAREAVNLAKIVSKVNSYEQEVADKEEVFFKEQTQAFQKKLKHKQQQAEPDEVNIICEAYLDEILPFYFALVREAARRTVKMRHFDVQIMGGVVLHKNRIAEMATGEGKTLVATLAASLNALVGQGVHIITVNDYLAKRDAEWMQPVYDYLGLTCGVLQNNMGKEQRREAYACDITYGTNNEFGFDYLRDNMATSLEQMVQRKHFYAIVDEVDSIFIDEARTPLIISGPAEVSVDKYYKADKVIRQLDTKKVISVHDTKDGTAVVKNIDGTELKMDRNELEQKWDMIIEEKGKNAFLTQKGEYRCEKILGVGSVTQDTPDKFSNYWVHYLNNAGVAHSNFSRDKDYVVKEGQVVIVDDFTGRLMPGRRWSEGIHQAIEAKENLKIQQESQTLATVTLQNYFRMYEKLSGMTGTAYTEAGEFKHIYNLEVTSIPTNKPLVRHVFPDQIYKTKKGKFRAIISEIEKFYQEGRPVLVGTVSIEDSEELSFYLDKKGVKHNVLNAKYHEREAHIVAQAGRLSQITIATNMAGRGTDILLGGNIDFFIKDILQRNNITPDNSDYQQQYNNLYQKYKDDFAREHKKVVDLGGLHVIGAQRHEARRIDNQLKGRAGRQGDPGSSRFYISLEDDLMRLFGSDRIFVLMDKFGFPEDAPIEHGLITHSIEVAQKRVEGHNFEIRKNLLRFDDVMNRQREAIYAQRREILEKSDIKEDVFQMLDDLIENKASFYLSDYNISALTQWLRSFFGVQFNAEDLIQKEPSQIKDFLKNNLKQYYNQREQEIGKDKMRPLEKMAALSVIDSRWKEHLLIIDSLKEGISLRGYAQVDPLVEYQKESYYAFTQMLDAIKEAIVEFIFKVKVSSQQQDQGVFTHMPKKFVHSDFSSFSRDKQKQAKNNKRSPVEKTKKVGRNDPCPCGSGKKYKKCCGR